MMLGTFLSHYATIKYETKFCAVWYQLCLGIYVKYSDTLANEDNSFQNHIC